jgi:hypothetical protein
MQFVASNIVAGEPMLQRQPVVTAAELLDDHMHPVAQVVYITTYMCCLCVKTAV